MYSFQKTHIIQRLLVRLNFPNEILTIHFYWLSRTLDTYWKVYIIVNISRPEIIESELELLFSSYYLYIVLSIYTVGLFI